MVDIDFNEPSLGKVNSNTKIALEVRNSGKGGGIKSLSPDTGFGLWAEGATGVVGKSEIWVGVHGQSNGVLDQNIVGVGVLGSSTNVGGIGVLGEAQHQQGGAGVMGHSKTWIGVYGESDTSAGVVGVAKTWVGVHGASTQKGGHGVFGESQHAEGGAGVIGTSKNWVGVYGESETKIGIWGRAPLAGYFQGDVEVTGDIRLVNADCAENFYVTDSEDSTEPGTVMVLNEMGLLQPSYQEYDKKVAGIVSGAMGYKPAIILDSNNCKENKKRSMIALVGKVYCKVDASENQIEIGDLLTTSSTIGHAMKAEDPVKGFGTVIGKALRSLKGKKGLIPVLVALQ